MAARKSPRKRGRRDSRVPKGLQRGVKRSDHSAEKPRSQSVYDHESRGAIAVTVGWLLCGLTTLASQLIVIILRSTAGDSPNEIARAALVIFGLVSLVAGAAAILLTLVTLKVRKVAPPMVITWAIVLIGISPYLILFY